LNNSKIQIKNNKYKLNLKYKAFSIVEALLAIALFSGTVTMMITTLIYAQESNLAASNLNKAAFIADEGLEAVKSIRNEFFTNITNGNYKLVASTGVYTLQPGIETIGDFTREITIDSNALDTQVQVQTIITDWQRTISTGINTWLTPIIIDEINISGNGDLRDIIIDGSYLFGLRASGHEVVSFDISDPLNIIELDDLNLSSGPYTMVKQGDFLYIASGANSQEIIVVDVSNPNHLDKVYQENLPRNNNNVDGVFTGFYGEVYIGVRDYRRSSLPSHPRSTQQYTLYAYDTTDPSNLVLQDKYMQIGNRMHIRNAEIKNNYVFLGTNDSNKEIIVIDVSNISNMTESFSIDLPGNDEVKNLRIIDDTMFVGTTDGFIYIYSVTNPSSPNLLSTITLTDRPHSFQKVEDFLLVSVENGSKSNFEVYNISNISLPTYVSTTEIKGDIKDIEYDPINNLVYLGTTNNSRELVVIDPS